VRKLVYLGVAVALSVVGLYLWEGPPVYIGEPIDGWVVDADARMPLEGVVVVATWFKEAVWGFHPHTVGPVMVLEAVTDAHGHFRISDWGPTFRGWGAPGIRRPAIAILQEPLRTAHRRQCLPGVTLECPAALGLER
jgi:hypothetical protein